MKSEHVRCTRTCSLRLRSLQTRSSQFSAVAVLVRRRAPVGLRFRRAEGPLGLRMGSLLGQRTIIAGSRSIRDFGVVCRAIEASGFSAWSDAECLDYRVSVGGETKTVREWLEPLRARDKSAHATERKSLPRLMRRTQTPPTELIRDVLQRFGLWKL